ncbi:MAG TPA: DMT family transporter [Pseudolabrys sp.]|nr:DMT family transporter [Pseudolabrys sp.]
MSVTRKPSGRPRGFAPLDYLLYAVTVLVWGLSWIALHYQVGEVAPEVSIVWRFAIAAPLMLAFAAGRGERLVFGLEANVLFAALGAAIFSTNYALFYYAGLYIASGLLSIVFSLAAIGNVALASLIFGTRIEGRVLIGAAFGALGVALMFYPELGGLRLDGGVLLGLVLSLTGTVSFCVGNMLSLAAQRRGLPIFATIGWSMLYGVALMALFAGLRGDRFTVEWSATYLGGLVYLSVLGSVLAFGVYFTLLGRIGAARAGYSTVMYPVIALIASTFAENYRWSVLAVVGLAAVLAGNLLVLRTPKR